MTPETPRSTHEQAERSQNLNGRTEICCKRSGGFKCRGESLIKPGYSWFSAKSIQVESIFDFQVKYSKPVEFLKRRSVVW